MKSPGLVPLMAKLPLRLAVMPLCLMLFAGACSAGVVPGGDTSPAGYQGGSKPLASPTVPTPATPLPETGGAGPGNLIAVRVSDFEVSLTWEDRSAEEAEFHIETATNEQFKGSLTITVPANVTGYSDKTVAPTGDTYYYRITAYTRGGDESLPSNVARVTIAVPGLAVPTTPNNLAATTGGPGQVNLTWTDNSTNETGFMLERATDDDFTAGVVSVTIVANATTYTDITVVAGKRYHYRLRAYNALGVSDPSDPVAVNASTSIQAPPAPANLAARALSSTQVRLSWSTTGTDQTGFTVERSLDSAFTTGLTRFTLPAEVSVYMTYVDTTVLASTRYYYRIFATNSVGQSPASPVAVTDTPVG